METNYKITIPKPCHEDWNQMTPDETGRFCNSCSKSVVDFTNMKTPEIQQYFIKNQGQKICGRFKNGQLDSIIIQIPREVLFSQVQFHKMFMLALLVSMGTTLFSCQNSNGDKQNIDKVEVVDTIKGMTTGEPPMPKATEEEPLTRDPVYTPPKTVTERKIIQTKGKVITSGIVSVEPKNIDPSAPLKKEIYNLNEVDVRPAFPKGDAAFYKFISSNVTITKEEKGEKQNAVASFVIDKTGAVKDVKILRGTNQKLNDEVIRVLKTCPNWTPAEYNHEKVNVTYTLPIRIQP